MILAVVMTTRTNVSIMTETVLLTGRRKCKPIVFRLQDVEVLAKDNLKDLRL